MRVIDIATCCGLCVVLAPTLAWSAPPSVDTLRQALTLFASFDRSADADFALGDKRIYSADKFDDLSTSRPGFHTKDLTLLVPAAGISGQGALRFTDTQSPIIFFLADKNIHYARQGWSGSVSFWLRVDPEHELAPGYCDPIQITTRAWNDAAFFVDFDQKSTEAAGNPATAPRRDVRLGVFSDLAVWNPRQRPYAEIPPAEVPMIRVKNPSFGRDRWTHVAFTWRDFNAEQEGMAEFYLDGISQGKLPGKQAFGWRDGETARIFLGIYYIGMFDNLACFNRSLSGEEIGELYRLQGGFKP